MPKFWAWVRRAAEMPTAVMGAFIELSWRVSPNPESISAALLIDKPEMIRQNVGFLLERLA